MLSALFYDTYTCYMGGKWEFHQMRVINCVYTYCLGFYWGARPALV